MCIRYKSSNFHNIFHIILTQHLVPFLSCVISKRPSCRIIYLEGLFLKRDGVTTQHSVLRSTHAWFVICGSMKHKNETIIYVDVCDFEIFQNFSKLIFRSVSALNPSRAINCCAVVKYAVLWCRTIMLAPIQMMRIKLTESINRQRQVCTRLRRDRRFAGWKIIKTLGQVRINWVWDSDGHKFLLWNLSLVEKPYWIIFEF